MALTADQIAVLSRLLDEALPLDRAGRERWLASLPPERASLLPALRQALLVDDDAATSAGYFAKAPGVDGDAPATILTAGLQVGHRVGPYELVRELAAGGMAVVWLARHVDGAPGRQVALKLPLLSRLRRDLAERFAREREILAQLEHANIARLYDAGVAADGLPYLALEYVEGESLTAWCDSRRCGVRERLKLFLQVLDAVQYAHARHVVHRDIKPSNIFVTDAGQVRLLDFGVAKLLAEGQADDRTDLTRVFGRALTPDYASPEQLRSEEIGPPSDVYALGVVLYELLVGSRPYKIQTDSSKMPLELAIESAQVHKPSTQVQAPAAIARATSHEKLARHLRGDLDAIVLKALERRSQDRYQSAAAFADDLQRYLSGEEVDARSTPPGRRLVRVALRHRVAAGGIVAALLAAVVLVGPGRHSWLGPLRARLAPPEPTADVPPDKSVAVLPFVDLSEAHNQEYFSDGLTDELIDRLARTGDLRVIARTSSFQFKGRSEDVRQIARKLGVASLLEGSVRRAGSTIRVTAQLVRGSDGSHLWSQTYDRDLTDVFVVQDDICSTVANALHAALSDGAPANAANDLSERNLEAYNDFLQGWYYYQRATQQDLEKSVAAYREALRLDPQYARAWAELARAYIRQGNWQWDTIQNVYRKARDAAERALAIDPNQPLAHRVLGYVYWDYDLNRDSGQAEFKKSRELDPSDPDALSALTIVALAYGRLDEAIELKRRNAEADPLNALMLDDLASLYLDAGRSADAETAVRRALTLKPDYTGGHCNLGMVLLARGQPDLALGEMQRESDPAARAACVPFAYWSSGRHAEADAAAKELVDRYADLYAYNIAQLYAFEGETDTAFEWLERAYRQRDLGLTMIKVDSLVRGLRGDPRFGALIAKMQLPR